MGAGVSAGVSAALEAARPEELRAVFADLDAGTRARLAQVVDEQVVEAHATGTDSASTCNVNLLAVNVGVIALVLHVELEELPKRKHKFQKITVDKDRHRKHYIEQREEELAVAVRRAVQPFDDGSALIEPSDVPKIMSRLEVAPPSDWEMAFVVERCAEDAQATKLARGLLVHALSSASR